MSSGEHDTTYFEALTASYYYSLISKDGHQLLKNSLTTTAFQPLCSG